VEPLLRAVLMAISFLLMAFLMMTSFSVNLTSWQGFSFFPSWQEFSFFPSWQESSIFPSPSEVEMAMLSSTAVCTCLSSPRRSQCQLEILWTCSSYPEEV
jgi:hypothetical protein